MIYREDQSVASEPHSAGELGGTPHRHHATVEETFPSGLPVTSEASECELQSLQTSLLYFVSLLCAYCGPNLKKYSFIMA